MLLGKLATGGGDMRLVWYQGTMQTGRDEGNMFGYCKTGVGGYRQQVWQRVIQETGLDWTDMRGSEEDIGGGRGRERCGNRKQVWAQRLSGDTGDKCGNTGQM